MLFQRVHPYPPSIETLTNIILTGSGLPEDMATVDQSLAIPLNTTATSSNQESYQIVPTKAMEILQKPEINKSFYEQYQAETTYDERDLDDLKVKKQPIHTNDDDEYNDEYIDTNDVEGYEAPVADDTADNQLKTQNSPKLGKKSDTKLSADSKEFKPRSGDFGKSKKNDRKAKDDQPERSNTPIIERRGGYKNQPVGQENRSETPTFERRGGYKKPPPGQNRSDNLNRRGGYKNEAPRQKTENEVRENKKSSTGDFSKPEEKNPVKGDFKYRSDPEKFAKSKQAQRRHKNDNKAKIGNHDRKNASRKKHEGF